MCNWMEDTQYDHKLHLGQCIDEGASEAIDKTDENE